MRNLAQQTNDPSGLAKLLDNIPRRPWSRLWSWVRRSRVTDRSETSETLGQRFFRHRADDALPLVVTHERIYILPSARGWMFVASLLIMLVASINYSLSLGYALCFLLTGMFASALLATYRNLAGISLNTVVPSSAAVGEVLTWEMKFHVDTHTATPSRRGITLRTDDVETDINLECGKPQSIHHRVPAHARGWQKLGRITLTSDYPLGLWRTWCYLHLPAHALILPKPESAGPDLPTTLTQHKESVENPNRLSSQLAPSGEFAGLRPYREGDALKNIAWKAAARGQGLQTMEFNNTSTTAPLTLDWESTAAMGDIESRLSRLAHWVTLANSSATPWRLLLPGCNLPLDSGAIQFAESMRALALHGQPADPVAKHVR